MSNNKFRSGEIEEPHLRQNIFQILESKFGTKFTTESKK